MTFKPTNKQKEVLDIVDKNVAVSASAGSGKTTVMIEKIANCILDYKIAIKDIMVVTFTNSASQEMKQRLLNKLQEKLKQNLSQEDKRFILTQIENIDLANICTIDKFCINLLKRYYYMLSIDGNFEILDDIENEKIKARAFDLAVNQLRKTDKNKIDELCDVFLEKRSLNKLKELSNYVLQYLYVQEDREEYKKNLFKMYTVPLQDNQIYIEQVQKIIKTFSECEKSLQICKSINDGNKAVQEQIDGYIACYNAIRNANLRDAHKIITSFDAKLLGNKKAENKEEIKNLFIKIQDAFNYYKSIFDASIKVEDLERQITQSKKHLTLLLEFVNVYESHLEKLKKDANAYSFADIEYFIFNLLKNEDLRKDMQGQIKLIFVDEYQDVNQLQEHLTSRLARTNNLFLVGDVKQSIYGFRLSEPKFFLQKLDSFADKGNVLSEQKNLNENFRSDKDILDFTNSIFSICMTKDKSGIDYKETSMLEGKERFNNSANLPKVCVDIGVINEKEENLPKLYSVKDDNGDGGEKKNLELQCNIIVNKVVELLGVKTEKIVINDNGEKTKILEPINFKDIAILFRDKSKLYNMVGKKLQEAQIPVSLNVKEDVFSSLETRFLSQFLRVLVTPYNDISFASVLAFPCFEISDADLLKVASNSYNTSFYSKVTKYINENQDDLSKKLSNIIKFIDSIKPQIYTLSVYQIYCKIIEFCDLFNYLLALPNGKVYASNLKLVLSKVSGATNISLVDYINYLDTKSDSKVEVNIGADENCVQLITIHASKGLEYKAVILAECEKPLIKTNRDSLILNENGIGGDFLNTENKTKCATFVKNYARIMQNEKQKEEEKRLLYVALTRAKNLLVITGVVNKSRLTSKENPLGEEEKSYLDVILMSLNKYQKQQLFEENEFYEFNNSVKFSLIEQTDNKQIKPKVTIFAGADEQIDKQLQSYYSYEYPNKQTFTISAKSSVSHYVNANSGEVTITSVPKHLTVMEGVNTNAEIGTAYHKCLELLDFTEPVNDEDIQKVLDNMKAQGFDTTIIDKNIIKQTVQILDNIIPQNAHIKKEQSFVMCVPYNSIVAESDVKDEVLVQGVIDLLILFDNAAIIVDYKNSKIANDDILRNKYKKQLELYKMALTSSLNVDYVQTYLISLQNGHLIKC